MSIKNLLAPNSLTIYAKEFIGEITDVNRSYLYAYLSDGANLTVPVASHNDATNPYNATNLTINVLATNPSNPFILDVSPNGAVHVPVDGIYSIKFQSVWIAPAAADISLFNRVAYIKKLSGVTQTLIAYRDDNVVYAAAAVPSLAGTRTTLNLECIVSLVTTDAISFLLDQNSGINLEIAVGLSALNDVIPANAPQMTIEFIYLGPAP